ncbi:flavin reductase family protein [Candidatus Xianfuyuplasma coldseepsis]|uniref:Flavin reductase family protein n=2 Tax=Candidatus Xianfuyuplasma coldseepsis TaxID=2782163 RepID=A0A7L7KUT3_9MOLU|nr:flavin reductase family protein [Xianfuyuplasma coldseepsis]
MLNQLAKGAFLTTKKGRRINTMTIAWGGIHIIWGKPVYAIYVRYSRETYNYLKYTDEFTISVPKFGTMKKELAYCGTKSARETDKIKDLDLTLVKGRKVETPVIQQCELHYECKIIYRQALEPNAIMEQVKDRYYPNNNFHMVYYGEIIDTYQIEGEE